MSSPDILVAKVYHEIPYADSLVNDEHKLRVVDWSGTYFNVNSACGSCKVRKALTACDGTPEEFWMEDTGEIGVICAQDNRRYTHEQCIIQMPIRNPGNSRLDIQLCYGESLIENDKGLSVMLCGALKDLWTFYQRTQPCIGESY